MRNDPSGLGEYRIDELSQKTGVTSSNIRAYQHRRLLHGPTIRGRVGIYDESHVVRLKVIDHLLERGFTSAHIAEFIEGWEEGRSLPEVLRIEDSLAPQRSNSAMLELTDDETIELFGPDPDLVKVLVDAGLLSRNGDRYVAANEQLIELTRIVQPLGFGMETLVHVVAGAVEDARTLARNMVKSVVHDFESKGGAGWLPEGYDLVRVGELLESLREEGMAFVHTTITSVFDDTIEQAVSEYAEKAFEAWTAPKEGGDG